MRNHLFICFAFLGLMNLFTSCEKDETKETMLANPKAPVITTVPDLVLKRPEASKLLEFSGTKADFGFASSVTYNLEADLAGNGFKNPIVISSSRVDTFEISVSDLNTLLIKTLPVDETLAMEFRVRAALIIEASGAQPIAAISEAKAVSVTTYGPPTLMLTTAGTEQGITSPSDNKIYAGWIYTDGTAFQFTNKDDGKIYGGPLTGDGTPATLTEDGPAITLEAGAYSLTADLTPGAMTMSARDVTIGIIGDGVGGWDNDTKMVYDFTDRTWNITIDVVAGGIKFRTHGGWADVNVAYNPAGHDLNNLYQNTGGVDSQNIDDIAPGKYNVKLYLETTPMKVVFAPVN